MSQHVTDSLRKREGEGFLSNLSVFSLKWYLERILLVFNMYLQGFSRYFKRGMYCENTVGIP
jgi:hypothetical protein